MSLEERFKQAWEVFLSPEAKFASLAKKEASLFDGALNFALGFIVISAVLFIFMSFLPDVIGGYALISFLNVTAVAVAFLMFAALFVFNFIFIGLFHLILKLFGSKSSFANFYYLFSLIALWSSPIYSIILLIFIISELMMGLLGALLGIPVVIALYTIIIYHLYQSVLAARTASGVSSLKTVFSMVLAFVAISFGLLFLLAGLALWGMAA